MIYKTTVLFLFVVLGYCNNDLPKYPHQTEIGAANNIYKKLDGKWKGVFYIYEFENPGNIDPFPMIYDSSFSLDDSYKIIDSVLVEQQYVSISKDIQRVNIIDKFISDGEEVIIYSSGTNSVENGNLYCSINKPEEIVNHQGYSPEEGVIIWHREKLNPLSIEYFYERVSDNLYSIIGWGYYGQDDLNTGPKTWFKAEYNRVYEKT
jgi:hypothetical protein